MASPRRSLRRFANRKGSPSSTRERQKPTVGCVEGGSPRSPLQSGEHNCTGGQGPERSTGLSSRAGQPLVVPCPPRVPSHAVRRGRIFCKRFTSSVFPTPGAPSRRHIPVPAPLATRSSGPQRSRPVLSRSYWTELAFERLVASLDSGPPPEQANQYPASAGLLKDSSPRDSIGDAPVCACARCLRKAEAEVEGRASSE